MKTFITLTLLFSVSSHAEFNIKKGLWSIETKMKDGEREFDPQAGIKKAMANMTPEQRKKMQAMIAKMGESSIGLSADGLKICYDGDMEKNAKMIQEKQQQNECDAKFPEKSSSKMVMVFTCKNGTKGTSEWSSMDSSRYESVTKMTDAKGKKTEIHHKGKFISSQCGSIKPISHLLKK